MPRTNTILSMSILLGAAIIAGAIMAPAATATKSNAAAQGDIALVDVYDIVDIIIMGEEKSAERAEFETNGASRVQPIENRLMQLQSQLQTADPSDQATQQLYAEYQQMSQMLQQTTNQINTEYQQMLSGQIADAYTTIHAAVNEVAADQGYTFVFATRRDTDLVQINSLTGVTQEILARPLVTPNDSVDLTDAVREHLALPTLEEVMARIEAEEAAAAAEAEQAMLDAMNNAESANTAETEPTPAVEVDTENDADE